MKISLLVFLGVLTASWLGRKLLRDADEIFSEEMPGILNT